MSQVFPRGSIMTINGTNVSEHGRQPISLTPERIGAKDRMWNGKLRSSLIANKYSFTVTWNDLPSDTSRTVDGYMGGKALKDLYEAAVDPVAVVLAYDGTVVNYDMLITSFSYDVKNRIPFANYDLVDVSMTFEQV